MNKTWLAMEIRSSLLSLMSGGRRIEDDHFAVIDLLRMIILHPDGATRLLKHVDKSDVLIEMINNVTSSPPLPANLSPPNLFKNSCYYPWLQKHSSEILDAFSSCCSSPNKNVQVANANLILNYSVLLIERKDQEGQSQVLSAAIEIAEAENLEVDSKYQASKPRCGIEYDPFPVPQQGLPAKFWKLPARKNCASSGS